MWSKELSKHADRLETQTLEPMSTEVSSEKESRAGRINAIKVIEAVGGIGLIALCAAIFYRIRELLAALILFSFVFGIVLVAVLILWLVEEATQEAAGRFKSHITHVPSPRIPAPAHERASYVQRNPTWTRWI
jgi:hypothetical protein